jgi:hypothetical protein
VDARTHCAPVVPCRSRNKEKAIDHTANPPAGTTIRSTETEGAATGARAFLTNTLLFRDQPAAFFAFMTQLAKAADAA